MELRDALIGSQNSLPDPQIYATSKSFLCFNIIIFGRFPVSWRVMRREQIDGLLSNLTCIIYG
ncbi:protein of unknown function [Candidatus Promineifilum breve]|uniref:Uncharacterized protein n=1 Tax=Candidatus Promineifilum breve TaxID=1806508 RepID=A0A160T2S8_9CHLR|nr:protein of unknown function [Candidatus Promineifilum breve]